MSARKSENCCTQMARGRTSRGPSPRGAFRRSPPRLHVGLSDPHIRHHPHHHHRLHLANCNVSQHSVVWSALLRPRQFTVACLASRLLAPRTAVL
ncbi:hypothetical protein GN956_G23736 [Arapaima gigas]